MRNKSSKFNLLLLSVACLVGAGVLSGKDEADARPLQLLSKWEEVTNYLYSKRDIRLQSAHLEFNEYVMTMNETKALLVPDVDKETLKKHLMPRIITSSKQRTPSGSEASRFYPFLYCKLAGLDSEKLVRLVGTTEMNLDVVLAGLFGGEEIDENSLRTILPSTTPKADSWDPIQGKK